MSVRRILIAGLLLMLLPSAAQATLIVTTPGDDSVLEAILDFDAGPLGLVDMDFGGNHFNLAFGTDAVPAGFLFSSTRPEALSLITSIQTALNLHNAGASTPISRVKNSVLGAPVPLTSYINGTCQ